MMVTLSPDYWLIGTPRKFIYPVQIEHLGEKLLRWRTDSC